MSNIADQIQDYILRRLAMQQDGQVELRRTDIADEISCAPSQISYVLSTRFTPARGFIVESRRGLGGFIRIAQAPTRGQIYQDMINKIGAGADYEMVESMVQFLLEHQMITSREAAVLMPVVQTAFLELEPESRVALLQKLLLTLARFS